MRRLANNPRRPLHWPRNRQNGGVALPARPIWDRVGEQAVARARAATPLPRLGIAGTAAWHCLLARHGHGPPTWDRVGEQAVALARGATQTRQNPNWAAWHCLLALHDHGPPNVVQVGEQAVALPPPD